MDTYDDPQYIAANRHIAERLLILLESRRLLQDRFSIEDYENCRRSAQDLRRVLEQEMLAVWHRGPLLDDLRDLQAASTRFVSAAGQASSNFKADDELFRYHLVVLREIFAQRLTRIIQAFDVAVTPTIRSIADFTP